MKRHRHTPEQIVRKLREGARLLNEGTGLAVVVRHLEVAESTWNRWPAEYGGTKADEAKRLRQLETENARLKKLLAEAELEKAMLKELAPDPYERKRRRPVGGGELFRAERPNHVWALDYQFDETADHRRLKLLNIVDEHTREALAMRTGRTCDADQVVAVIEARVAERGAPEPSPDGQRSRAHRMGPARLVPAGRHDDRLHRGSPWENPFVESFNGRVRNELLNVEEFGSLLEAQVVVEAWRAEYKTHRPDSSRGGLTPAE